jgi:hypothetical protein
VDDEGVGGKGSSSAILKCAQADSGTVAAGTVRGRREELAGDLHAKTRSIITTCCTTVRSYVGHVGVEQVSVSTITVDDGSGGSHTMKVGQTAYFYDSVSASFVTREITAVAATTITIAGAAVTVADNAVISNNLRIMILRTVSTGTIYKFVAEIPNNSFSATQVYTDATADASLGLPQGDD